MPDPSGPELRVAGWLLTYLLHSAVLLLAAELLGRTIVRAPVLRDGIGKAALLAPVVTATIACTTTAPVGTLRIVAAQVEEVVVGSETGSVPDAVQLARLAEELAAATGRPGVPSEGSAQPRAPVVTWSERAPLRLRFAAAPGATPETVLHQAEVSDGLVGDRIPLLLRDAGGGSASMSPGGGWRGWLIAAWLVGALVGFVRLARGRTEVSAIRTTLTACTPRSARLLHGVARGTRLRLRSSRAVVTPCVLPGGIVVLSERAERTLDDEQLSAVLAHEVGHVVRRDTCWFPALEVLSALFWLQPLNRVALRSLRANAELACDDFAVGRTAAPTALARTIAAVAEWGVAPIAAGAMPIVRGETGTAARVERLLRCDRGRSWPRWSVAAAAAALILSGAQLPAVQLPAVLHATFIAADLDREQITDVVLQDVVGRVGRVREEGRLERTRVVVRRFEGG